MLHISIIFIYSCQHSLVQSSPSLCIVCPLNLAEVSAMILGLLIAAQQQQWYEWDSFWQGRSSIKASWTTCIKANPILLLWSSANYTIYTFLATVLVFSTNGDIWFNHASVLFQMKKIPLYQRMKKETSLSIPFSSLNVSANKSCRSQCYYYYCIKQNPEGCFFKWTLFLKCVLIITQSMGHRVVTHAFFTCSRNNQLCILYSTHRNTMS